MRFYLIVIDVIGRNNGHNRFFGHDRRRLRRLPNLWCK